MEPQSLFVKTFLSTRSLSHYLSFFLSLSLSLSHTHKHTHTHTHSDSLSLSLSLSLTLGLFMYRSSADDESGVLILAWFKSGQCGVFILFQIMLYYYVASYCIRSYYIIFDYIISCQNKVYVYSYPIK